MRNPVMIRLGGVEQALLPTWGAYAEIEARTGKPLRALWINLVGLQLELRHMAMIVTAGMKANAQGASINLSDEAAMRALFEEGPWWDIEGGVGRSIQEYLEALAYTPEQREKLEAERKRVEQATLSAGSSPTAPAPTD